MKILLTGRTGQVGWELERRLGEVTATDRRSLDLADPAALSKTVREAKPAQEARGVSGEVPWEEK